MMTHKLFPSFGDSGFKEHRLIFDAEKAEPVPAVAKDAEKKETAEKTPDAKAAKRIGAAEKDMEKVGNWIVQVIDIVSGFKLPNKKEERSKYFSNLKKELAKNPELLRIGKEVKQFASKFPLP